MNTLPIVIWWYEGGWTWVVVPLLVICGLGLLIRGRK